jgi:hypothetical protein
MARRVGRATLDVLHRLRRVERLGYESADADRYAIHAVLDAC